MQRNDGLRTRSTRVGHVSALVVSLLLFGVLECRAATTYYVATNGTGNGDSWAAATNNIQGAIDRTIPGDTVLVSNGVYEVGGKTAGGGALTNRVVITNAITVQSANNNPATAIIKGAKDPSTNGPAAVRCVWMNAGSLIGFTVTNGATLASGGTADLRGGGVYCDLTFTPIISNCVIVGNSAQGNDLGAGGGTFAGTVYNCTIMRNTAVKRGAGTSGYDDGGRHFAPVNNSMIVSNTAGEYGGGAYACDMNNCLIAGNTATAQSGGGGCNVGTLNNCTIVGNTAVTVGGLQSCTLARNCIVYFNTGGWANFYQGGEYEFFKNSCTAPFPSGTRDLGGNTTSDPLFLNTAGGNYHLSYNSPCIDKGTNEYTGTVDLDGKARIYNNIVDMGAYEYQGRATYYVATNGTGNGDSWAAATNNIQGAIDRTIGGDIVLVSNGVYDVGGMTAGGGALTNRVVITNAITVQSANNNPAVTIIKGAKDGGGLGPAAVRCVWMNAGSLIGFTVTNGATLATGNNNDLRGGGIYCDLTFTPIISNCVIAGNSAKGATASLGGGGGSFCGTVNNCTIIGNSSAGDGGGAAGYSAGPYYYATVNNSVIISNTATTYGGGAYACNMNNCLVVGNSSGTGGGGCNVGTLNNCTIVGNAGVVGGGVGGLQGAVLVRNSIVYFNTGAYRNYVEFIVAEYFKNSCTIPLPAGGRDLGGNTDADPVFLNASGGNYRLSGASPCVDKGTNEYTGTVDLDGKARIYNNIVDMGAYEYHGFTTYYVATNGTGNGDSWAAATNNIQGAIDRTTAGDIVLVSNGVYDVGGTTAGGGALTNRVAITNAITVRSVNNNPAVTIIKGAKDGGGLGAAAVRCVWMNAGSLIGFTITNGATLSSGNNNDLRGGGIYCDLTFTPIISNCVIAGNSSKGAAAADGGGGGTFCGTMNNCTIIGNSSASGGGVAGYYDTVYHYATLNNCMIISNTATTYGGGAYACSMNNCLVVGNYSAFLGGGGQNLGILNNCTVVGNTASGGGGGVLQSTVRNSIVYFNNGSPANYYVGYGYDTFEYSCTTPAQTASGADKGGNYWGDPGFLNAAGGDYRLKGNSLCVNAGTNVYAGTVDLNGNTRIRYGIVDMGAYEYIRTGAIFGFR